MTATVYERKNENNAEFCLPLTKNLIPECIFKQSHVLSCQQFLLVPSMTEHSFCVIFLGEEKNVFWVKILSQSEVDKLYQSSSRRQILSSRRNRSPNDESDIFEPEDPIWLLAHGCGKCEIIATLVDEEFVKARPKRLVVNVPKISMS